MSKTTVLMADEVLREAKAFSQERDTTLGAVVEAAVIDYLARQKAAPKFRLRKKHSLQKGGMFTDNWENIRTLIHEDRESRAWKP